MPVHVIQRGNNRSACFDVDENYALDRAHLRELAARLERIPFCTTAAFRLPHSSEACAARLRIGSSISRISPFGSRSVSKPQPGPLNDLLAIRADACQRGPRVGSPAARRFVATRIRRRRPRQLAPNRRGRRPPVREAVPNRRWSGRHAALGSLFKTRAGGYPGSRSGPFRQS